MMENEKTIRLIDRRREFAWLTCHETVKTIEELTERCKRTPIGLLSKDVKEMFAFLVRDVRRAMPRSYADDQEMIATSWHPAHPFVRWTHNDTEFARDIEQRFCSCLAWVVLNGINVDERPNPNASGAIISITEGVM